MTIELVYFDGCPNAGVAEDRLRTALRAVGREDSVLIRIEVANPEDADRLGFIGSPTVRVDGRDPFATGDEPVAFACRVYRTPAGLSGSPTIGQFVEVLS